VLDFLYPYYQFWGMQRDPTTRWRECTKTPNSLSTARFQQTEAYSRYRWII